MAQSGGTLRSGPIRSSPAVLVALVVCVLAGAMFGLLLQAEPQMVPAPTVFTDESLAEYDGVMVGARLRPTSLHAQLISLQANTTAASPASNASIPVTGFPVKTDVPTPIPSLQPSAIPTPLPSTAPSMGPSDPPTYVPTAAPSFRPTYSPTNFPTVSPTRVPSHTPSEGPTQPPTQLNSTLSSTTVAQAPNMTFVDANGTKVIVKTVVVTNNVTVVTRSPTSPAPTPPTEFPTRYPTHTPSSPSPTHIPSHSPSHSPTTRAPTTQAPTSKRIGALFKKTPGGHSSPWLKMGIMPPRS